MKLSRKERKIKADKKRIIITENLIDFYIMAVLELHKNAPTINNPYRIIFNEIDILKEESIKKFPKEAHMIRSVFPNAKKQIQEKFKKQLRGIE